MSKSNTATAMLRCIFPAAALIGAAITLPGCYAGVDDDVAYYPSAGFVATSQPVFYEGHATYWYNNHWVYRDGGGRWGYYRSEPGYLSQRRGGPAYVRHTYERPAGRPAGPRPGSPRR